MQKSTILLLIIALASTGVSAGLWMQLRAERALNAELSERLVLATATRPPPPIASPAAETPPVTVPVVTAATPAAAPVPAAAPDPAVTRGRAAAEDWMARQRKLMSDPRYREAYKEQQRLRLATRRDNFIRLVGLTPEQADTVIGMSIDREMQMREGPSNPEEYETKLRQYLGEEKAAKLDAYMESRQSRMQVDQLKTQLAGADMLRDDQVEPLIAALHAEQADMQRELREFGRTLSQESDPQGTHRKYVERENELLKEAHRRMSSSAAAILTNSQLQQLDAMLKRDLARRETQLQMSRIQSKLNPPEESPAAPN